MTAPAYTTTCAAARNSARSSRNSAARHRRCPTSDSTEKNGLRKATVPAAPAIAPSAAMKKTTSAMRGRESYEGRRFDDLPPDTMGSMLRDVAVVVVAFAVVTALAEVLGAANLGTAMTFGQMAAVLAAAVVVLRSRAG